MSACVARSIRRGIVTARTPSMWPVYLFTPWAHKAFGREFKRTYSRKGDE